MDLGGRPLAHSQMLRRGLSSVSLDWLRHAQQAGASACQLLGRVVGDSGNLTPTGERTPLGTMGFKTAQRDLCSDKVP